jgi:hypothetical protein
MTVTILDDCMSSDRTQHTARLAPGHRRTWVVSWLPSQHLDRNSAITAMVLADTVASDDMKAGHRLWPHVEGWAAELALTAPEAITQIASQPGWANADRTCEAYDPEAAE